MSLAVAERTIPDPFTVVDMGLAVFPLPPGGKTPTLKDWPNRATRNRDIITRYWPHRANIGVPCRPNRLLVVDLDRGHSDADGVGEFRALCERHGQPWPDTYTVQSPRGGLHLYMWCPPDRPLGNTAGRLGPGIDTSGPGRGNRGGYVIGATSVVNGRAYTVVNDAPIQPLPCWLADLLDPPRPRPATPAPITGVTSRYVRAALEGEIQRVLDAQPGGRNSQLNRSAFALGQLVGAGVLNQATTEHALRAAAAAVGLVDDDGPRQVEATIISGLTAGMRKPRQIRGRS